jgi:metal iron transporter
VAIIATDLSELLGSAIALCLLFPKLQLWHGVLVTACDVILILAFRDPLRGTPVRMFEILIGIFVCSYLVLAEAES